MPTLGQVISALLQRDPPQEQPGHPAPTPGLGPVSSSYQHKLWELQAELLPLLSRVTAAPGEPSRPGAAHAASPAGDVTRDASEAGGGAREDRELTQPSPQITSPAPARFIPGIL